MIMYLTKKYKALAALLTGTMFFAVNGYSQSALDSKPVNVVSPSPVAASLFKDVNVPVNYYTGTPQIGIPIYTVKIGSIQMPISLSYTATGIKVEQESGWVGLGWDLQTGGAIGRSIIGMPDEQSLSNQFAGYRASATVLQMPEPGDDLAVQPWISGLSACNIQKLVKGNLELTPDNYFMHFNGNSARLVFDKNGKPYFSPYKAWKLSGNENAGFTVVTENGTTYVFGLAESSSTSSETEPSDNFTPTITANTTWYLTEIISASKVDTLNIAYTPVNYYVTAYNPSESYSVLMHGQIGSACNPLPNYEMKSTTTSTQSITGFIIKSITTRNQRVDFIASAGRKDVPNTDVGMPYKLDAIQVFNISPNAPDKLLRKFVFTYDYFAGSPSADYLNQRLKLLSVSEMDPLNTIGQVHSMTYYNDMDLPSKDSKGQDSWGYYNGHGGNTTLIPSFTDNEGIKYPGGDRSADETYASYGLLHQLTYPTGGKTTFEYEANRYATNKPGERDSIRTDVMLPTAVSGTSTSNTKTFSLTYRQYINVSARITEPQDLVGEAEVYIYNAAGNSVFYTSTIGTTTQTILLDAGTYTTYVSKDPISTEFASVNVYYSINVASPVVGVAAGGARISRIIQTDGVKSNVKRFQYLKDPITSSGKIINKPIYSGITLTPDLSNCFAIPQKVGDWMYYSEHSVSTVALGRTQGNYIGYTNVTILYGDNGENGHEDLVYSFFNDVGGSGFPFTPQTSYDDVRGLLLERNVYTAGGKLVKTEKNEYDYNEDASGVNFKQVFGAKAGFLRSSNTQTADGCPDLSRSNEWSALVESYRTCQIWPTLNNSTTTTYSSETDDPIAETTWFTYNPSNLQPTSKKTISSRGEELLSTYKYTGDFSGTGVYDAMIARNMISSLVESDEYNNNVLVDKQLGDYGLLSNPNSTAVLKDVRVQKGDGPLETRVQFNQYDDGANLVEQQKASDISEVYLWGYQSQYPVAKIVGADYNTAKQLVDQAILDNPSGDQQLRDELAKLRTGLPSAQVYTYTFVPLVGMSSETDLRGITTYYEYDGFGRLVLVRDKDGNILKKLCYNYAGQPENCSVAGNANWQPDAGTRCILNTSGYNTGYQEQEQKDMNPLSSTYNLTRWANVGINTSACPLEVWQPTGTVQCSLNASGYNTGDQEQLEKDVNLSSPTYNIIISVSAGTNTTACPLVAWVATGNTRCALNGAGYNSGDQEQEQKDMNPSSPSYNQTQWVDVGANLTACPLAAWQPTGDMRCVINSSNQNTGEQEQQQRDLNPASPTYNQLRWVSVGNNFTACPLPCSCSGEDKKCVNGTCETGMKIYTGSEENPGGPSNGYTCTYHYEWSDGTWSQDYTEQSGYACFIF